MHGPCDPKTWSRWLWQVRMGWVTEKKKVGGGGVSTWVA